MIEFKSYSDVNKGSEKGFGIVFAIVFLLLSLYPFFDGGAVNLWALAISLIFISLAFLAPHLLEVPNRLWFKLGIFIGGIVAPIVMVLIFFFVITPVGIIIRLAGKDLLHLRFDNNAQSYWSKREDPVGTMKNQF